VQTIEASFPYTDDGVKCIDSDAVHKLHPHVSTVASGDLDVEKEGTYYVTYDSGYGHHESACELPPRLFRTVIVKDMLKPVIAVHYGDQDLISTASAIQKLEIASPHNLVDIASAVRALEPHKTAAGLMGEVSIGRGASLTLTIVCCSALTVLVAVSVFKRRLPTLVETRPRLSV
jgi:hypothetical protein